MIFSIFLIRRDARIVKMKDNMPRVRFNNY